MDERDFEDIICKYPELIEDGLTLRGRQVQFGGKRADILFTDRHGVELIQELKKGTVVRKDVGQLLDYEGHFLSPDKPPPRVMLVGNHIPESFRRSLEYHGIESRELSISRLRTFLMEKSDTALLECLKSDEPLHQEHGGQSRRTPPPSPVQPASPPGEPEPASAWGAPADGEHTLESRLTLLSAELREVFFEFHARVIESFARDRAIARPHKVGVTYLATARKAFIVADFRKNSITLKFYAGSESISGTPKSTWITRQDKKAELFHLRTKKDIPLALDYGRKAYAIVRRKIAS